MVAVGGWVVPLPLPPAQIPACAANAPGSCRRSDVIGLRGLGGRLSMPAALIEPVALAVHLEDVDVVDEARSSQIYGPRTMITNGSHALVSRRYAPRPRNRAGLAHEAVDEARACGSRPRRQPIGYFDDGAPSAEARLDLLVLARSACSDTASWMSISA